ncbi:hypothetical protein ACFE04_016530 [Oxalis oulophora]
MAMAMALCARRNLRKVKMGLMNSIRQIDSNDKRTRLLPLRFQSTTVTPAAAENQMVIDFPGGKVKATPHMNFLSQSPSHRVPCYTVLDDDGKPLISNAFQQVSKEVAIKIYSDMVTLQTMDTIFYELQRQGRISFYVTTLGEEAINIATAAALTIDDLVVPQHRLPMAMSNNESDCNVIEPFLTYRVGHHSTSDDSTKYRQAEEIEWWRQARDPVSRFRKWVESNGWWSNEAESELRSNVRKQILHAIQVAEKEEKPPVADLFTDVYDIAPSNLCEQESSLRETITRHSKDYPTDVPMDVPNGVLSGLAWLKYKVKQHIS